MYSFKYLCSYLICIILSILFLIYSIHIYHKILNNNECQMTYSKRDFSEIPLCGNNCLHKLHKISNPKSKKLNKQPVLFIPGNMGSSLQARSLASSMHNDNNDFQYFAMQYDYGFSAYHASDIISQAYSFNNALHKIKNLYKKDKKYLEDSFHIMVIGHSIGGIIPRIAFLLKNHPSNCIVRDIIQLSTPNTAAPYVPDASLDRLYSSMNKAWEASYLNQSSVDPLPLCKYAMRKHVSTIFPKPSKDHTEEQEEIYYSNHTHTYISNEFHCPRCVDTVRIISITGGEIDLHVKPELTNIHSVFATSRKELLNKEIAYMKHMAELKAKNSSAISNSTSMISLMYGLASSTISCIIAPVNCITQFFSFDGGKSVLNATVNTSSNASNIETNEVSVLKETKIPSSKNDELVGNTTTIGLSDDSQPSMSATNETSAIIEPVSTSITRKNRYSNQFLSIRTNQLAAVGFPIDHDAMVWCYDLLQVLTQAMLQLAKIPITTTDIPSDAATTNKKKSAGGDKQKKKHKGTTGTGVIMTENDWDWNEIFPQHHTSIQKDIISTLHVTTSLNSTVTSNIAINSSSNRMIRIIHQINKQELDWNNYKKHDINYLLTSSKPHENKQYDNKQQNQELKSNTNNDSKQSSSSFQWFLKKIAYDFLSQHNILKCLVCFLLLTSLVVLAPFIRSITGNNNTNQVQLNTAISTWEILLPHNYLNSELIFALIHSWTQAGYLPDLPLFSITIVIVLVSIGSKFMIDFIFYSYESASMNIMQYIYWFVAYFIAVAFYAILLLLIISLRWIFQSIGSSMKLLLRWTIWNQYIRRSYRALYKNIKKSIPYYEQIIGAFLYSWKMNVSLCLWGSICYASTDSYLLSNGISSTYMISTLFIMVYIQLAVGLFIAIVYPTFFISIAATSSTNAVSIGVYQQHLTALIVFYLPVLLWTFPTLIYTTLSLQLQLPTLLLPYFSTSTSAAMRGMLNPLGSVWSINSSLFAYDQFIYLVIVMFVSLHLWSIKIQFSWIHTKPLRWLYELLGPHIIKEYRLSIAACTSKSSTQSPAQQGCLHEDGGKYAIYEAIDPSIDQNVENIEVRKDIILGSTYKVISCNCAKDYSLKDINEYCSWCLCYQCGGKHLPRNKSNNPYHNSNSYGEYSSYELNDISIDVIPLIGFLGMCWLSCYQLYDKPYYYLYYLGFIAFSFMIKYFA